MLCLGRWVKATQTEMVRARQTSTPWPRMAENACLDVLVACERILTLLAEGEIALQKTQGAEFGLAVSQIQAYAQDIELMLSRVAE
jgi:hypothetical protein